MALEVVKEINKEIEGLKAELKDTQKSVDELKAIGDRIADLERKKTFNEDISVTDRVIKSAENKATAIALKSAILARPVDSFAEYKEVAGIVEKAIKPSDIPNWITEQLSSNLIDLLMPELNVEPMFGSVVVPDKVDSLSFPTKTSRTTAYRLAPDEAAIESALAGSKITFKPEKIKVFTTITDEAKMETVLDSILDVVKQDMVYTVARASEEVLVMGDTTGAQNENPGANSVTMIADGLLKQGKANSVDNGGGVITIDALKNARKAMGYYGVNSKELVLIVNPTVYNQLLNLTDFQTLDKVGSSAVLLTGMIEYILGMKIIVTDTIPTNLNASGDVDSATPGTQTAAIIVNTKAFKTATKKVIEAERDRDITKDRLLMTLRRYFDFQRVVVETNPVASIVNIAS